MVAAVKSKKAAKTAVAKVSVTKVKKSKGKAKKEAQRLLKQESKKAISDKVCCVNRAWSPLFVPFN